MCFLLVILSRLRLWLSIMNGLVYGTDGVETWSVLAKVQGWYKMLTAGADRENGCVSTGAQSVVVVPVSHGSARDSPTRWCKLNIDVSEDRENGYMSCAVVVTPPTRSGRMNRIVDFTLVT
ncbi:hypothetical protein V6N11_050358 [Hibiscus sabdariffa]|uniref:Secreted protein n=1 Tax=Hibiscus sabdariffa TaxID=183260 RepID=A0ABR2T9J7_9ROSI